MQSFLNDKKYSVCSLYSGSKGNSVLIRSESARILIDAGKSADIDAIFITHEHCDHVKSLEVLLKKHPMPVHIVEASAKKLIKGGLLEHADLFCIHSPRFEVEIGNIKVSSFETPHDSEFSVGYKIDVDCGDSIKHIGYATDIGYVTDTVKSALMGCETVVLESNHDTEMLMDGPYPYDLKLRIASKRGHLSNCECALLSAELCANGTKNLLLAHLSEENNRPEIAFDEVSSSVADESVNIKIAHQNECVVLV